MGEDSTKIVGKVARILSEYQLVLNVGEQHGVVPGAVFVIFEQDEEITDPDSGESLGCLEMVKARVHVAHVQETICLVESARKPAEDEYSVLSARMAEVEVAGRKRLEREHYKLAVRRQDVSGSRSLQPIQVGDYARLVEGAPASE